VSGGKPVAVEGTDLPLWGMEVDPEQAKDELRASMAKDDGAGAKVHKKVSRQTATSLRNLFGPPRCSARRPESAICGRTSPQFQKLAGC